jgi:hypothetical protein
MNIFRTFCSFDINVVLLLICALRYEYEYETVEEIQWGIGREILPQTPLAVTPCEDQ